MNSNYIVYNYQKFDYFFVRKIPSMSCLILNNFEHIHRVNQEKKDLNWIFVHNISVSSTWLCNRFNQLKDSTNKIGLDSEPKALLELQWIKSVRCSENAKLMKLEMITVCIFRNDGEKIDGSFSNAIILLKLIVYLFSNGNNGVHAMTKRENSIKFIYWSACEASVDFHIL